MSHMDLFRFTNAVNLSLFENQSAFIRDVWYEEVGPMFSGRSNHEREPGLAVFREDAIISVVISERDADGGLDRQHVKRFYFDGRRHVLADEEIWDSQEPLAHVFQMDDYLSDDNKE